jgi:hypothetical protein
MLIIKIELHSAVTGQITTIAIGTIVNTGTGNPTLGNYRIELRDAASRVWKTGHIEGFPRKRLIAWDLLYRALKKLVESRNSTSALVAVANVSKGRQPTKQKEPNDDRPTAQSERPPQTP